MGNIIQVQDFSVHDGDGIRTVIFFSGCPLRCRWCANPESWTMEPKLAFFAGKCVGCGLCASVCPRGLLRGLTQDGGREQPGAGTCGGQDPGCTACGLCAERCPQGALRVLGTAMTAEEIVKKVERDSIFFGPSGGGVTFSGGEATVQEGFLRELTEAFCDRGISMWLETCGFFPFENVRDILLQLDHIFFDLKHMDTQVHRRMTGQGNELILENCRRVYETGIPVTLRIPAVPEVNLTAENLRAAASFILEYTPGAELELLPYHAYGEEKYEALRIGGDHFFSIPSGRSMEQAEEFFRGQGIRVVRYR